MSKVFLQFAILFAFTDLCLVLLCDQNSFGRSKLVLVWPNWFWLDHNDLVTTKMKWSRPKWIGQVQMWFILVENHNLDLTNSFWSWPFHFGRDHFILVVTKSLWSSPNQFGQTKTILDRPKLFWSHRRTRHYITETDTTELENLSHNIIDIFIIET